MNIKLNSKAMEKINFYRKEYKERGLKTKDWNEILSQLILSINDKNWVEEIEKTTPDDFHLSQLLNDPDEKAAIIQMLIKKRNKKTKTKMSLDSEPLQ